MSTDEKYLDDLLKTMTEGDTKPRTMEDAIREMAVKSEEEPAEEGGIAAEEPVEESNIEAEEPVEESNIEVEEPIEESDLTAEASSLAENDSVPEPIAETEETHGEDNGSVLDEEDAWKSSLDELMAQVDYEMNQENAAPDHTAADTGIPAEAVDGVNDEDALAVDSGGAGGMDDDLEEINGLLNKTDRSEAVDDDMLALLESMNGNIDPAETDEESFDLFGGEGPEETKEVPMPEAEEIREEPRKKRGRKEKSKQGFGLFGKKKKKDDTEAPEEEMPDASSVQPDDWQPSPMEETMELPAGGGEDEDGQNLDLSEEKKPPKEKKPGFFAKLLIALTEEEDDGEAANISAENEAILNELEEEDQKEKKKRNKKDKKAGKKKKGKGKEENQDPDADQEEDEAEEAGRKKKKAKESRKEKKAKNEHKEKPVKVLGRKNLLLLVSCCATLLACILLLSTFLPEYSDKAAARNAYYAGDYEEAYELLYDKRLDSSDKLVFNRVKTVLRLERRINSYENNLAMGRELEALDALLQGVGCYQDLAEADEYGVRSEVDALYQQIIGILENSYGITADEAVEINTYEAQIYTRKLHSVIEGTEFVKPGEEKAVPTPAVPQDILPEEEEMISY